MAPLINTRAVITTEVGTLFMRSMGGAGSAGLRGWNNVASFVMTV